MNKLEVDQIQNQSICGNKPRILVCGIGSRHFLNKYLELLSQHNLAPIIIAGTELKLRSKYANQQLQEAGVDNVKILPVSPISDSSKLNKEDLAKLNILVEQENINAVIITAEATAHMPYLKWAVQKSLPCLVEKPLTSYDGVAYDFTKTQQMLIDYEYLKKTAQNNGAFISIVSQRRWNKAFLFIKDRIEEVFDRYEVPVSLMRGMKNKGEWLEPRQLLTMENHPYKYGYGVLSHTGYHPIDILDYVTSKITAELGINRIEVFAQMSFPRDVYLGTDNAGVFNDPSHSMNLDMLGECSVNGVYTYYKDNTKIALSNIQISNNGLTQKDFSQSESNIWEQSPGTVRQESYCWTQGPFQEIDFELYQDKTGTHNSPYDYGGTNYGLITIKRNGKKNNVERISLQSFEKGNERVAETCLKEAISDFIARVNGTKVDSRSDLKYHEIPIKIECGLYQSSIKNLPISYKIAGL